MDSTQGAYRVTTASSSYLVDLDRMVVRRFPRTGNSEGSLLRRDDELVTLLDIGECTVGRRMILLIDLHVIGIPFTVRASTPVIAIEQVPSPGTEPNQ